MSLQAAVLVLVVAASISQVVSDPDRRPAACNATASMLPGMPRHLIMDQAAYYRIPYEDCQHLRHTMFPVDAPVKVAEHAKDTKMWAFPCRGHLGANCSAEGLPEQGGVGQCTQGQLRVAAGQDPQ